MDLWAQVTHLLRLMFHLSYSLAHKETQWRLNEWVCSLLTLRVIPLHSLCRLDWYYGMVTETKKRLLFYSASHANWPVMRIQGGSCVDALPWSFNMKCYETLSGIFDSDWSIVTKSQRELLMSVGLIYQSSVETSAHPSVQISLWQSSCVIYETFVCLKWKIVHW